jgi:hypothetical protein
MVEIKNYFCCNPDCHKYGLRDQNNIVKAGTYGTGERKKQMLKCTECGKRFSEPRTQYSLTQIIPQKQYNR